MMEYKKLIIYYSEKLMIFLSKICYIHTKKIKKVWPSKSLILTLKKD